MASQSENAEIETSEYVNMIYQFGLKGLCCLPAYVGGNTTGNKQKLENRAIRVVSNADCTSPVKGKINELYRQMNAEKTSGKKLSKPSIHRCAEEFADFKTSDDINAKFVDLSNLDMSNEVKLKMTELFSTIQKAVRQLVASDNQLIACLEKNNSD